MFDALTAVMKLLIEFIGVERVYRAYLAPEPEKYPLCWVVKLVERREVRALFLGASVH